MLNSLSLKYFRQHIDKTIDFTAGMNAIRGANEAGKSTVIESFAYLCYGARALRQSLEEVVTYHQPVSKLRVEGTITHLGVVYTAYRAKSGAEVTFGSERITGQTEVTKFFEQLFGADAALAGKLMVANQKSLGESLAAGPTAAGQLIEELANFSLIDDMVELMQTKTPTGLTAGLEGRIQSLKAQLAGDMVEDHNAILDLVEQHTLAETERIGAENVLDKLVAARSELDVDLAKSILADQERLQREIAAGAAQTLQIHAELDVAPPIAPSPAALAAARQDVEDEKQWARAAAIHRELTAAKVEDLWDKDLASLEAEVSETQEKSKRAEECRQAAANEIQVSDNKLAQVKRDAAVAIATAEGKLIKETTCAFCAKDLTDVPEVVQRNSQYGKQLEELRAGLELDVELIGRDRDAQIRNRDGYLADRQNADSYLKDLQAVITRNGAVETLYAKAGDFITVDRSTVPSLWTWTGPAVEGDRFDVQAALTKLEAADRAATADLATRAEKRRQLDALATRHAAAVLTLAGLQVDEAKETIVDAAALDQKVVAARAEHAAALAEAQRLASALATKQALQEQAAQQREKTQALLAADEAELTSMQRNNALVKKIKAARPVITDKLWTLVLAGASKYFSEVRGESSIITRGDSTFRCNGQPVAGLSGSAQDMLGLAIRITLSKTFLPGSDFLILDEPGAACSDYRETAMLGMLSTLGFGQIIMVSHSTLVDAFSDHVITI